MAWDTEGTRQRLLDAGARQFAEHGFAGTRMDAIGRDAGVNKERVYKYFGDKQGFFDAVLSRELGTLLDGLEGSLADPDAAGRFTGDLFDRCRRQPTLPRLLAWESLEVGHAVALDRRQSMCAAQVTRLESAVSGLDHEAAQHLLLTAITVVVGAWTLGGIAESVLGTSDPAARRDQVVQQMRALARPDS
ncbi:TetR/AcrR family transcriptional regulator [Gordonia soli]|uniref:Putative TetR family transcriptional regulator n=1 Tax=Gordonia soli NBRC 108243 TaxID=1223545 RepID=M0QEJ6_9ACTN|nr:TetR/AcrR family transcriptional regulator [Gordonia soli]GAC67010.1 putative TetR family transcriptional regulator [Gordonia soli NBRC 108243]